MHRHYPSAIADRKIADRKIADRKIADRKIAVTGVPRSLCGLAVQSRFAGGFGYSQRASFNDTSPHNTTAYL